MINEVIVKIDDEYYKTLSPCQFDIQKSDYDEHEFNIDKWTERTGRTDVKIYLLKETLADMDYKGQKYLDGEYTEEETKNSGDAPNETSNKTTNSWIGG